MPCYARSGWLYPLLEVRGTYLRLFRTQTTIYPMTQQLYSEPEAKRIERTHTQEVLERAKYLHRKKRYELRIDERTTILVEKKNYHRAYAEAYRERMNKQQ